MTKEEAKKIFDEKFHEIGFGSAFENVGAYIGVYAYGYSFYAFDAWKEVLSKVEDVEEEFIDDSIYVPESGVINGQKYLAFFGGCGAFVVELAELRRQMFEDLRTLESC